MSGTPDSAGDRHSVSDRRSPCTPTIPLNPTSSTERTKVIHILTRLAVGGAQEIVLNTCAMADRSRFDQILVVGPQTGAEGQLFDEARRLGVPVIVAPSLVRQPSPRHDLRATVELARILKAHRPEIVHTHSSKAGVLGRVAARWCRTPAVVHSVHGWSFHERSSPLVHWSTVAAERAMARCTDRFVVEADSDLRRGIDLAIGNPDQYRTIRNGVELGAFPHTATDPAARASARRALRLDDRALVIGTVIRLVPQKNPQGLVRAAARVVPTHPEARFVIVGDGPLRPDTEALAKRLGIADHVRVTGIRRDVAQLLPAFDVFALSSHWEGLPRVVLEAMATGLAVVAPRVDGMAEAVQDEVSGLLVAPGDPEALAAAILATVDQPGRADAYGRAGRAIIEDRYDVRRMIVELEQLYESLTGSA